MGSVGPEDGRQGVLIRKGRQGMGVQGRIGNGGGRELRVREGKEREEGKGER